MNEQEFIYSPEGFAIGVMECLTDADTGLRTVGIAAWSPDGAREIRAIMQRRGFYNTCRATRDTSDIRLTAQIAAVLWTIRLLGYEPLSVPIDAKEEVLEACRFHQPDLCRPACMANAWKQARKRGMLKEVHPKRR